MTGCENPAEFDTCRPVAEDIRSGWAYRSACTSTACDRAALREREIPVLRTISQIFSGPPSLTGIDVSDFLRCSPESAAKRRCVVLDSIQLGTGSPTTASRR
jgi:hypothetical protein